ncbi:guanylate kinase [Streptomyces diastatochromogenes]|uniref:guanylate kinase n=1 Tax=Streptomyces diastatochromogenes TaxID=42236 RepID=UPI002F260625
MTRQGVVLYGPPAAGKDTVTKALATVDARYELFARLKVGSGKTDGYRMGTAEQLHELEAGGDIVYANARYGNTYVIDRPGLDAAFAAGVPVVHLGQVAGLEDLLAGYPADWLTVLLWCPRATTERRSQERGDADTAARVRVWAETKHDLDEHAKFRFDVVLQTDVTAPEQAARLIDRELARRAEGSAA